MGNFIPHSTSNKIIFPYSYWDKTFDISAYTPLLLTGNRMSAQEVSQTIANIQDIQSPFSVKIRTAMWTYIFLVLMCLVIFLGIITTVMNSDTVLIALIIYSVVIFALAAVYISYIKKIRVQGQSQVQRAIDHYNQAAMAKGLRWSIPIQFPRWIELNVEFTVEQGVYMPPIINQPYSKYGVYDGQPQQYAQNYYGGSQPGYNHQQGGYNPQQNYVLMNERVMTDIPLN